MELNYAVTHKENLYALLIITIFIRYVARIPTVVFHCHPSHAITHLF